jgi:hypothetical protein
MRRAIGICILSGLSWSTLAAASNVTHSAITPKSAATTQMAREKEPGDDRGGKNEKIHHHRGRNGERRA